MCKEQQQIFVREIVFLVSYALKRADTCSTQRVLVLSRLQWFSKKGKNPHLSHGFFTLFHKNEHHIYLVLNCYSQKDQKQVIFRPICIFCSRFSASRFSLSCLISEDDVQEMFLCWICWNSKSFSIQRNIVCQDDQFLNMRMEAMLNIGTENLGILGEQLMLSDQNE